VSRRGDTFKTKLKSQITLKDKIVLSENTEIRGLVKRVVTFQELGDIDNRLLLFDEIVMPDGRAIPLEASLDTDKGSEAIIIKWEKSKDIGTLGGSVIVGPLIGKNTWQRWSTKRSSNRNDCGCRSRFFF